MMCDHYTCPQCNDKLIHLVHRGAHESSSELGQYIHDELPNQFYLMDNDVTVFKRATKILRVVEHKYVGQGLSNGQIAILPKYAMMIHNMQESLGLHPASGVFAVWSDSPFDVAVIQRVSPTIGYDLQQAVRLDRTQFQQFLSGELMTGSIERVQHQTGMVGQTIEQPDEPFQLEGDQFVLVAV